MGRTLPSATIMFMEEQESLKRFRRALRRSDQIVLDTLFDGAHQHISALAYGASALPFEMLLLAMLLEQQKMILKLRADVPVRRNTTDAT